MSARPGQEYVINRAMHLCNPPLSWREIAREMAWLSSRSKTCLLQRNYFIAEGFCVRRAQFPEFLVNCFEEIVMATNNSGLDSNYLLVSEKRREKEEEKGIE